MCLLPPFFHLTSTFFGLTTDYKVPLLEEIYICTQHLKGFTYSDVLALPTYERRFFLGLLTKDVQRKEEQIEKQNQQTKTRGSKGNRSSSVSGAALKNKMKSGEIPNN